MDHYKEFIVIFYELIIGKQIIYSSVTIGEIKNHFRNFLTTHKKDPNNYNIDIYINPRTKLYLHSQYDNMKLTGNWKDITQGYIVLSLIDLTNRDLLYQEINDYLVLGKSLSNNITGRLKNMNIILPQIRVGGQGRGVSYPSKVGFEQIPAWSRGSKPWKNLSPFFMGPVIFDSTGKGDVETSLIFENFWQSRKVYNRLTKQNQKSSGWRWPADNNQVDEHNNPTKNWYLWNEALNNYGRAVRRPNGRAIPLYAYWKGQKLGVINSRKQIYIPHYQILLRQNIYYQTLLDIVKKGGKIIIIGPDGPDPRVYKEGREVNLNILTGWINKTTRDEDPNRYFPYGHEYVIALTLLQDLLDWYRLKLI